MTGVNKKIGPFGDIVQTKLQGKLGFSRIWREKAPNTKGTKYTKG